MPEEQAAQSGEIITSLITALHGEGKATSQEGVSEAASENTPKRKRGRPTKFDCMLGLGSNAKTRRGEMEAEHARAAAHELFDRRHEHPEFTKWTGLRVYDDGSEYIAYDTPQYKLTVLAELGRLICDYGNGRELAVQWAVEILNMKPQPNAKEAMRLLRSWRLGGKGKVGDVDKLATKILVAVDDYVTSHSDASSEQIIEALEWAISCHYPDDEGDEEGR